MNSFNNNDPFKQFVKSKLADYEHEAPPNGWEELQQSISAAQKTKVIRTRWLASSVAAVAAAFIGVFFIFQNTSKELTIQTAEVKTEQQTAPSHKEEKPLITKSKSTELEKTTSTLIADNASLLEQTASTSIETKKEKQASLSVSDNDTYTKKDADIPRDNETGKKEIKQSDVSDDIDEEKKQQMIQDFINEGKRSTAKADEIKTIKNKSKYTISLSGQSAFASSHQTTTMPTTLRSSLNETYGSYTMAKMQDYNEEKEIKPESETNHIQPISFGILTSLNITPKLQIETGLIYTYLSSETTNKAEGFINTEKVQFHYLGIPVNVNYTLLSVNKLDLFVSAGAMIEKDIDGKIKYNDEKAIASVINSGYTTLTSSKISQKKPQLSLTSGLGVTYPLYNRTKLFGKIGGRYYINANNEYKTYYSDEKFGLDIQLGIKFNF
ncbi:MAG: PorT family protein [Bacteroidales bacterium]|nr:PorT family protein [Bacteroidales bacterium]